MHLLGLRKMLQNEYVLAKAALIQPRTSPSNLAKLVKMFRCAKAGIATKMYVSLRKCISSSEVKLGEDSPKWRNVAVDAVRVGIEANVRGCILNKIK